MKEVLRYILSLILKVSVMFQKGNITFSGSNVIRLRISVPKNNSLVIGKSKSSLSEIEISSIGGGNLLIISGSIYKCKIGISGNNNKIIIEDGVFLNNCEIVLIGDNCHITIKAGTTCGGANIVCMGTDNYIEIGEDCMLSSNIDIWNTDSHQIVCDDTIINHNAPIKIGNHVWIGKHAAILKGVTIGDNAIVGMHSVITKSIPSSTLWAGQPAKQLKGNVSWNRERIM